jgi:uncharacterized protein YbjT (DUF2867 family)
MHILVCGADGFLGRAIAQALAAVGHHVIRAVHHPRLPGDLAVDYRRDLTLNDWLPRLSGVDAVVNAVGILREPLPGDFARLHHQAPAALFAACAQAGIARIVQVSALGQADATPYLSSKWAADAALLAAVPQGAAVLRPGLVFGAKGASSRFFLALASLPILPIAQGAGQVQPVHAEDVALAVRRLLEAPIAPSRILELPGPRALDYAGWLEGYRGLLGLPRALHLPIPAWLMRASARLAGHFRWSLLTPDTWTMLACGNTGDPAAAERLLGRPLRDPADFSPPEAAPVLRAEAIASWRRPLFIGVLAALWLLTAWVSAGLFPIEKSLGLLRACGLSGLAGQAALGAAILLDALMGLLTLLRPGRRLWACQLALVGGYTAIVICFLPQWLLHPFAPIVKNLAVAALLISLWAETPAPDNKRKSS